jgi:hypothetical protein
MASVTIKPFQPGLEFSTQFKIFVSVNPSIILPTQPILTVKDSACPYEVGSLVKLPNDGKASTQEDSAVYYYGKDCKRHAFPNDKVFFSWYTDFDGVSVVSSQVLANMMLGASVTYRPGFKMVKFTTVDKVYAVAHGGILRWVTSEAAAKALHGSAWNKEIDDISDAFFVNYSFGPDISKGEDYNRSLELDQAQTINQDL